MTRRIFGSKRRKPDSMPFGALTATDWYLLQAISGVALGAGKLLTGTFYLTIQLLELSTKHINTSTLTTAELTSSATCLTVQRRTAASNGSNPFPNG